MTKASLNKRSIPASFHCRTPRHLRDNKSLQVTSSSEPSAPSSQPKDNNESKKSLLCSVNQEARYARALG